MRKNLIVIAVIFALPILAYWLATSFSKTDATAAVTGKPQIIKFTSKMCLDCQTMNKIMKEIYPKYENDIILTEINVQDGSSFSDDQIKKYNVTLVPTIILLDSQGKQVKRIEGAIEQNEMEKCLEALK